MPENLRPFISGALGPLTEAFGYLKDAISDNMPAVQDLGAKFGKWMGEAVKKIPEVISKVKDFGKWVTDGVNKVKDFAGGWKNIAKIAGGIAVAPTFISGLKTAFSLGKTVVAAFKTIGPVLSGLKLVAAKSLGGIIVSAAPVIAVVAGIAAAAYLIIKNWDKVKPVVVGVFNKIKGAANTVIAAMKAWWDDHGEKITGVIDKIGEFIGTVFTKARESVGAAIEQISAWWDENGEKIMSVIDNIREFIGAKFNEIQGIVGAAIDRISAWWGENGEAVVTKLREVGAFIGSIFRTIGNVIGKVVAAIGAWWEKHGDKVIITVQRIGIFIGSVFQTIAKVISMVISAIQSWWIEYGDEVMIIVGKIGEFVGAVFNNIKEVIGAVISAVQGWWSEHGDKVIAVFEGIKLAFGAVAEFFRAAVENIISHLEPFLEAFKRIFGGVITFFSGIFTGDWEKAVNGIKNIFGGIVDYFKTAISLIIGFFQPLLDVFGTIGDFVGGTFKKVGDFVGGLFGGGKNKEVTGHADGGIFAHRHIAEIAEKGAEAVVPLNNTERGRKIWEQAGQMGGYMDNGGMKSAAEAAKSSKAISFSLPKQPTQVVNASPSNVHMPQAPSIIERAAGERLTGGDSIVIHFNQKNTFGGTPDSQTIQQIEEAGRNGAKDLENQLNELLHNRRRVSYAAYTRG